MTGRGGAQSSRQLHKFGEVVGGDILGLIINGMYNDPLTLYREYIQNSADSIALSGSPREGRVEITMDIGAARLRIRDNGPGLTYQQAQKDLIYIANSNKKRRSNRGFRGIGRLAGLAFSDSVTFLTRSKAGDPVTRIAWDGVKLRESINNRNPIEEILSNCVTIDASSEEDLPDEFFEVQLDGISRHVIAPILNREAVRKYISETCPVPFREDFRYASDITNLFVNGQSPLALNIYLDDGENPVTRPHQDTVHLSESHLDSFSELEKVSIPALDGEDYAAIGWIMHSSYQGALPKDLGVRCIRAREGNIQIGDETVFDHLFTETRFNRWCVAEMHIVDSRITPNGRRDYFEPGPHLRNLENHLGAICRKLEKRCRAASVGRNQRRHFLSSLSNIDGTLNLAHSGYLDAKGAKLLIEEKLSDLEKLKNKFYRLIEDKEYMEKLEELKGKLDNFKVQRGRLSFPGIQSSQISSYKNIFAVLAKISPSPEAAQKTIEAVLEDAKNSSSKN